MFFLIVTYTTTFVFVFVFIAIKNNLSIREDVEIE